MKRSYVTHLAIAAGIVFGVSWIAYAELGGGDVMLPYHGTLHDGGAPVTTEVTMTFDVWTAPSGGGICLSQQKTFTPANGAFAVTIGPLGDGCLRGNDLYLQVRDPDGNPIGTRRRVYPSIAAASSGGGDFHVEGVLTTGSLDATGSVTSSSVDTGTLVTSGDATLGRTAVVEGDGAGGTSLTVKGRTQTDALTVTGTSSLGNVSASSLTVSGTLTLQDLSVPGQVTWNCPADTWRVGDRCVTSNRGNAPDVLGTVSYHDAVTECHDDGMTLCPLDVIFMCDELNTGNAVEESCGWASDLGNSALNAYSILTGTPATGSGAGIDGMCYWGTHFSGITPQQNYRAPCGAGQFFFCCSPVVPTTL